MVFRGDVEAAAPVRQGRELQRVQGHKAQIPNIEILLAFQENVAGLQIHIQITGFPADSQGGAQVNTHIDRGKMSHGTLTELTLQSAPVVADEVYLVADALFHGDDLVTVKRQEAPLCGKLFQYFDFTADSLGQVFEITLCSFGIGISAGKQERFQLNLGRRYGDRLNNISFIRIVSHGRITADAAVGGYGTAQGNTVQQGSNQSRF